MMKYDFKLIVFFVFGVLFLTSLPKIVFAQDYPTADFQVVLDSDGHIPSSVWSEKFKITSGEVPVRLIDFQRDLTLLEPFDGQNLDDVDDKKAKADLANFIELFKKAGFDFSDENQGTNEGCVSSIDPKEIDNSGIYGFCICRNVFIVNPKDKTQAIFVDDEVDSGGNITGFNVQKIAPDIYRVFVSSESGTGCGYSKLKVSDFNFQKNTVVNYKINSEGEARDLGLDGNYSLVLHFSYNGCWRLPRVYSWDGKMWAENSGKYWGLYKTGELHPWICGGGCAESDLLDKLEESIRNDEPLKYWVLEKKDNSALLQTRLSLAVKYELEKNYQNAISEYENAITLDENNEKIWFSLGSVYLKETNMEALAKRIFEKTIKLDDKDAMAHYDLAYALWIGTGQERRQDEVSEAVPELIKALKLDHSLMSTVKNDALFNGILQTEEFQKSFNN